MTRECGCSRPIHDQGAMCRWCADQLRDDLLRLADLAPDLELAATRQARFASGPRSRSGRAEPLPFDPRASRLARELLASARAWAARWGCETGGGVERTLELVAAETRRIRMADDGPATGREAARLLGRVARAVDRPADARYVGPCEDPDCRADLFAGDGDASAWIRCRACGRQHDAVARRELLIAEMEDRLVTAPEAVAWLRFVGVAVSDSRVRTWVSRGRLVPAYGATDGEAAVYRVGDALRLAGESAPIGGLA